MYSLGDHLIVGDVKQKETYAYIYRRHISSIKSPFKLPYSYSLMWDSSGINNQNSKAGQKIRNFKKIPIYPMLNKMWHIICHICYVWYYSWRMRIKIRALIVSLFISKQNLGRKKEKNLLDQCLAFIFHFENCVGAKFFLNLLEGSIQDYESFKWFEITVKKTSHGSIPLHHYFYHFENFERQNHWK